MRQTVIVAVTTALVTAIVATWGTTIIVANTTPTKLQAQAPSLGTELTSASCLRERESREP